MVTYKEKDYSPVVNIRWLFLSILSLIAAVFGLVHHYVVTGGVWWQPSDFWHHEPLIAIAFIVGITLLTVYLSERWQTRRGKGQNNKRR
jgi:membrane protein implicated in regulation of membrane protease activity